jgi:hypothetical protein
MLPVFYPPFPVKYHSFSRYSVVFYCLLLLTIDCTARSKKSLMPKFIVKPKKQNTESTTVEDNTIAPVAEERNEAPKQTNVLQSLCQNYDSDESE